MWIRASLFTLLLLPTVALAESPAVEQPNVLDAALADNEVLETTQQAALAPCPGSPNCVSSAADPDSDQYVEPLQAGDTLFGAIKRLTVVLADMERVTWTQPSPNHIHAEFKSSLFGFVDEVDLIAAEDGSIAVRSASRTGYWDMGVNRKRVEELRERLSKVNSQI
ncbi:MAG: DUF1499 domain-containing protein [Alcanivoracaceae bacterium]